MPFLGSIGLDNLIKTKQVIVPEKAGRIKLGAYELSLGNEVFMTDSKDGKKETLTTDKEQIVINPGQFALLLTEEEVNIPLENIAFISIKASIKLRGLINVSGFHVDPGFKGKLVFSVYNAGSGQISMEKGAPCFLIWFAELDKAEIQKYGGEHLDQASIPLRYIDALKAGELASPNVLLEKINDNYKTLNGKLNTCDYIFKTGLGIIIVVAIKFLVDWGMYDKGQKEGYEKRTIEIKADSSLNKLLLQQRNLMLGIDSLEKIKKNTETQNK